MSKNVEQQQKRQHRATYARDKENGGWLVRVEGPYAQKFAGREVPVTSRDDSETMEQLDVLLWTGTDEETKRPVALYSFIPKPKDEPEEVVF